MLVLNLKKNECLKIETDKGAVLIVYSPQKNSYTIDAPKEIKVGRIKYDLSGLGDYGQEPKHSGAINTVHENEEIK